MQIKETLPVKLGCFVLGASVVAGTVLIVKNILKPKKPINAGKKIDLKA